MRIKCYPKGSVECFHFRYEVMDDPHMWVVYDEERWRIHRRGTALEAPQHPLIAEVWRVL